MAECQVYNYIFSFRVLGNVCYSLLSNPKERGFNLGWKPYLKHIPLEVNINAQGLKALFCIPLYSRRKSELVETRGTKVKNHTRCTISSTKDKFPYTSHFLLNRFSP